MRKRSRPNALQPIEERTWLVISTMAGEILHSQSLDPLTDLRRVLDEELQVLDRHHARLNGAKFE